MGEDGEENAIHGGFVLEGAHGAGSAADLAESAFDGIGGAHGAALVEGFVAKAGEELVEVVAQAIDRLGVDLFEAVGQARGGRRVRGRRS